MDGADWSGDGCSPGADIRSFIDRVSRDVGLKIEKVQVPLTDIEAVYQVLVLAEIGDAKPADLARAATSIEQFVNPWVRGHAAALRRSSRGTS